MVATIDKPKINVMIGVMEASKETQPNFEKPERKRKKYCCDRFKLAVKSRVIINPDKNNILEKFYIEAKEPTYYVGAIWAMILDFCPFCGEKII